MNSHDTKASVAKSKVKAKKSLGQHFLINDNTLSHIAQAAVGYPTIVEVGPGMGALTKYLVDIAPTLHLVEKDRDFRELLETEYTSRDSVTLDMGDILAWEIPENIGRYAVVANIPYFITTPIIKKFLLDAKHKPEKLTLLVQKEFAEKAVAKPPKATSLSIFIQLITDAKITRYVPRNEFSPPPKVDSAVLELSLHSSIPSLKLLRFVEKAFHTPRKTLGNNLKQFYPKENLQSLDAALLQQRPETLSVEEWKTLWNSMKNISS